MKWVKRLTKIKQMFDKTQPDKIQFYKDLKKLLKDNYLLSVCDFDEENYEIQYEEIIFNWGDIWINGRKIGEFKSPKTCLKIIKALEEE